MIGMPLVYFLFVVVIGLQVLTIILLSNRLKSIEHLVEVKAKELNQIGNLEKPSTQARQFSKNTKNPVSTINNQNIVQDNQDEEILFIKEIKLDRRSKVIDMDVQVNKGNK